MQCTVQSLSSGYTTSVEDEAQQTGFQAPLGPQAGLGHRLPTTRPMFDAELHGFRPQATAQAESDKSTPRATFVGAPKPAFVAPEDQNPMASHQTSRCLEQSEIDGCEDQVHQATSGRCMVKQVGATGTDSSSELSQRVPRTRRARGFSFQAGDDVLPVTPTTRGAAGSTLASPATSPPERSPLTLYQGPVESDAAPQNPAPALPRTDREPIADASSSVSETTVHTVRNPIIADCRPWHMESIPSSTSVETVIYVGQADGAKSEQGSRDQNVQEGSVMYTDRPHGNLMDTLQGESGKSENKQHASGAKSLLDTSRKEGLEEGSSGRPRRMHPISESNSTGPILKVEDPGLPGRSSKRSMDSSDRGLGNRKTAPGNRTPARGDTLTQAACESSPDAAQIAAALALARRGHCGLDRAQDNKEQ